MSASFHLYQWEKENEKSFNYKLKGQECIYQNTQGNPEFYLWSTAINTRYITKTTVLHCVWQPENYWFDLHILYTGKCKCFSLFFFVQKKKKLSSPG